MAISDWPASERPREKLLSKGANTLSDAELLAIFLRTGCAGKSAVDLARELLTQFNGLRPILEADHTHFCQAKGLGDAKYSQLAVYPRELVKAALAHNAAAIIIAHNHPSGVSEPSQADKQITHEIRQCLSLMDIRVLDHVVIGEGETTSFAERGWL